MTEAIRASTAIDYYPDVEGASRAENEGQICLPDEHLEPAPSPAPSPPRSGSLGQSAAPPSLLQSLRECSNEALGLGLKIAGIAVAAPETLGASLLAATVLGQAASSLLDCVEARQAERLEAAKRQAEAGDCQANGGQAVQGFDGALLCLKP